MIYVGIITITTFVIVGVLVRQSVLRWRRPENHQVSLTIHRPEPPVWYDPLDISIPGADDLNLDIVGARIEGWSCDGNVFSFRLIHGDGWYTSYDGDDTNYVHLGSVDIRAGVPTGYCQHAAETLNDFSDGRPLQLVRSHNGLLTLTDEAFHNVCFAA
jgi:hypothetical protein